MAPGRDGAGRSYRSSLPITGLRRPRARGDDDSASPGGEAPQTVGVGKWAFSVHLVGDGGQLEGVAIRVAKEQATAAAAAVELSVANLLRLAAVRHVLGIQPLDDAVQLCIVDEQGERPTLGLL